MSEPQGRPTGGREAALFSMLADWRRFDEVNETLLDALRRAETAAQEQGLAWDDCPVIPGIIRLQSEFNEAQNDTIRLAARLRAATVEGVLAKLILWRDHSTMLREGEFAAVGDRLPFSCYLDLIDLTGRDDLRRPADDKALAAMREDGEG